MQKLMKHEIVIYLCIIKQFLLQIVLYVYKHKIYILPVKIFFFLYTTSSNNQQATNYHKFIIYALIISINNGKLNNQLVYKQIREPHCFAKFISKRIKSYIPPSDCDDTLKRLGTQLPYNSDQGILVHFFKQLWGTRRLEHRPSE